MLSRSSRLSLCDPMDYNTTQLPCPSYFLEITQTHLHWVDGGIQPSCPLLSPSLPAFNPFQHQGFFQWVSSSHQVARCWSFNSSISPYSGLISFRTDWFVSLQATRLSRVFSNTTVRRHQLFGSQPFFIVQPSHLYMTTGKARALAVLSCVRK